MAGLGRKSGAPFVPLVLALVSACGSTRDGAATRTIADPRGGHGGADGGTSAGGSANGAGGASGASGKAGSGGNAGAGNTPGTGGTSGAGGASTGGAILDAGSTDGAAGTRVDAGPPPVEIPSRQSVTFRFTNKTGSERFIATAGNNCTPFGMAMESNGRSVVVPLEIGFQCPCECPRPGDTVPTAFHRIAAGETYTVAWDARVLSMWREIENCLQGPPAPQHVSVVTGVLQPAVPGTYTATFGIEWVLPLSCVGTDPDYQCDVSYDANPVSMDIAPTCSTTDTLPAVFSLPATGDVDVPIVIELLDPI